MTSFRLAVMLMVGVVMQAAQAAPKVAVTDLTYEEQVREYFHVVAAHSKISQRNNYRDRERESPNTYSSSSRGSGSLEAESSYYESEGVYSYVDRGELRKFTGDLKGALLRSGQFSLVQGKPYGTKALENIHDIIARIKRGDFAGADYVLFGTVSSLQFRDEVQPIPGANTVSRILALELVADFSLIDTRTYEIRAALGAIGEGQDTRLVGSRGAVVTMSRGKVINEVSKSLAENAARQIGEQFAGAYSLPDPDRAMEATPVPENSGGVTVFR